MFKNDSKFTIFDIGHPIENVQMNALISKGNIRDRNFEKRNFRFERWYEDNI